jgi:hypothetical protein
LPITEYKVKMHVEAKKYKCGNAQCAKRRYAEELPFAAGRGKRTKRLDEYIKEIGLRHSSVEAAAIIGLTHAEISNKTVLRVVEKNASGVEV